MEIALIIYLAGFIATYIITKLIRNKARCNEWSDIIATFLVSLFSWIGVFIFFLCYLTSIKNNIKPPKFL